MAASQVARRMTDLEEAMADLARAQKHAQLEVEQTSREMRAFKDEMRAFKNEMGEFKDEMLAFKGEANKRWGELANKLGTMAEDLVAPSVPRLLRELTGRPEDLVELSVRHRKRHATERDRLQEFDVVAVSDTHVLVVETRSRLRPSAVEEFLQLMTGVRSFFPEHAARSFIGALATLYPDDGVVRSAERAGIVVLGIGEDLMDVRNAPGWKPRKF